MVRQGNSLTAFGGGQGIVTMARMICSSTGLVTSQIDMPESGLGKMGVLLAAMTNTLEMHRNFNPTAAPKPRIVPLPAAPSVLQGDDAPKMEIASVKAPPGVDGSGTLASLRFAKREGADQSADKVFEQVAGAVYVVRADNRQGSAVAVSANELLTNCHVVGNRTQVTLKREKTEILATLVSANTEADRCVLKTEIKLPVSVGVRRYDEIKVGERALSVGTPFGFELTLAEGVVSSKRTHRDLKLVQTSAPISQGSSGGGLFDAQGNLLGITTFQSKFGQNLNFALAAEDYAKVSN